MPSLKSLRTRISSVKNTKKITSTMKMVAAAKMRRAKTACEAARPFSEAIKSTVAGISQRADSLDSNVLLKGYDDVKTVKILVFGSDKGLCGGFNDKLLKSVEAKMVELEKQKIDIKFVAFGNKAINGLKAKYQDKIDKSYPDFSKEADFSVFKTITDELIKEFEDNQIQKIYIAYNKFVNVLTQEAVVNQLVPAEFENTDRKSSEVILEPSAKDVLKTLLPRFIASNLNSSYLESFASEQACRMTAMEGSTKNAKEVIEKLSLQYNRQRQANITSELVEIISGAQAQGN